MRRGLSYNNNNNNTNYVDNYKTMNLHIVSSNVPKTNKGKNIKKIRIKKMSMWQKHNTSITLDSRRTIEESDWHGQTLCKSDLSGKHYGIISTFTHKYCIRFARLLGIMINVKHNSSH